VQEALTNVRKHAGASRVRIELSRAKGDLRLRVADDGVGFDLEADRASGRFGLKTMEERAASVGASLVVAAARGEGVRLELTMPLRPGEQPRGVPDATATR
jgi:signal transduction histidine kinase